MHNSIFNQPVYLGGISGKEGHGKVLLYWERKWELVELGREPDYIIVAIEMMGSIMTKKSAQKAQKLK